MGIAETSIPYIRELTTVVNAIATDLRKFARSVPVCDLATALVAVREKLRSGRSPYLAVVEADRVPVGIVRVERILPLLLDPQPSLAAPLPAEVVEAIDIIRIDTDLARLGAVLAERSSVPSDDRRLCVLVEPEGQFVGVLDTERAIAAWAARDCDGSPTQVDRLADAIDSLASPMMVQDRHGDAIACNRAWSRQIAPSVTAADSRLWQFVEIPLAPQPPILTPEPARVGEAVNAAPLLVVARDTASGSDSITAANADLMRRNRFKDELLSRVGHELKTAITSLLGLSKLLADPRVGELSDRQERYVSLIRQNSRKLMRLVNDTLDLTRVEDGQIEIDSRPVATADLCHRAWKRVASPLTEPPPEFVLDIDPSVAAIAADEGRVVQILAPLLSESVRVARGSVTLQVAAWDRWVAFILRNQGSCRLEAEEIAALAAINNDEEGTGLEWVLARKLARLHGGELSLMSRADRGCETVLLLPHDRDPAPAKIKGLILLAQIDDRDLAPLADSLADSGYRVVVARSTAETEEKAQQLRPAAIFLGETEAIASLEADPRTRSIPLVAVGCRDRRLARVLPDRPTPEQLAAVLSRLPAPPTARLEKLTILWCVRESEERRSLLRRADAERLFHQQGCRVLEVEDLEQAELLARVWKPDVFVLEPLDGAKAIAADLEELSHAPDLTALPCVTLDRATTEIANRIVRDRADLDWQVYPCLAVDGHGQIDVSALLAAMRVAVSNR